MDLTDNLRLSAMAEAGFAVENLYAKSMENTAMTADTPQPQKIERGRQPLYVSLADILSKDILGGKYAANTSLPSEKELTELYGVSRVTVRQSMRILRDQGLVSSHAGIGTLVRPINRNKGVFDAVNSTEELLAFVENTKMHLVSLKEVVLDRYLAELLECSENTLMSEVSFFRTVPDEVLPMSFVKIFVPPRYAAAQKTEQESNTPIYRNIERMFGVRVCEIRQDVMATLLRPDVAEILQAEAHEPALQMLRFFFDENQTMVQVSISYYPASRYKQSARFRVKT